jgi:4-methyl-5(b-hydroxyethyl)-thiazole monophosphate biosynthesis
MKAKETKRVLMPLADGFDEIEAFTLAGTLKRAGLDVRLIGLQGNIMEGSDGTKIIADGKFDDIDVSSFDALVLVGGPCCGKMGNSERLMKSIRMFNDQRKPIAAIGEAPCLLADAGLLGNRKATILPGMERRLSRPRGEPVVVDGHIMTAQSPADAMDLGLKIIEHVVSPERVGFAREVLRGREKRL